MAFERNDIVNKTRLMGELGEELMGFEHNDIVTVDVMNEAIAEGGGGGIKTASVSMVSEEFGAVPATFPAIYDGAVEIFYNGNDGETYQIPIGEGGCYMSVDENVSITDFESDSDNIQINVEDRYILVLGDGTLTYTGE